jgi:hypothetical protein
VLTFLSVLGAATVSSRLWPWWQGGGGRYWSLPFGSLPLKKRRQVQSPILVTLSIPNQLPTQNRPFICDNVYFMHFKIKFDKQTENTRYTQQNDSKKNLGYLMTVNLGLLKTSTYHAWTPFRHSLQMSLTIIYIVVNSCFWNLKWDFHSFWKEAQGFSFVSNRRRCDFFFLLRYQSIIK